MKKGNTGNTWDKTNSAEVEVLRERIKQMENSEEWQENKSTSLKSESALKYRIKELHLSEKNLLEEIKQLRMNLCHVEMTTERVKSRVQNLQAEFADLVQQQERAEVKSKAKLQQLQDSLRIKDEAKRQSQHLSTANRTRSNRWPY
uniref:Uncharacterized protein n=1 Tax=Sphaerodactylus townsendi TaxID=933632 RepID=A0ACB8E649_9SAUR